MALDEKKDISKELIMIFLQWLKYVKFLDGFDMCMNDLMRYMLVVNC